jgi:hypothetical protein
LSRTLAEADRVEDAPSKLSRAPASNRRSGIGFEPAREELVKLLALRIHVFRGAFLGGDSQKELHADDYELVSAGFQWRPPASVNVYGARGWGRAGFHGRPPRLWASAAVAVTVAVKFAGV